jgi:hypothetical protein
MKIVTVGLNPSKAEFPENNGFARFPTAVLSDAAHCPLDVRPHLEAMNAYFYADPYRRWFNSYETLLNGLDCSFYGGGRARRYTRICVRLLRPTRRGAD